MKKLLFLVAITLFFTFMLSTAFTAVYSDKEGVETELIAGSLELSVNGQEKYQSTLVIDNLAPGSQDYHLLTLSNTGTVPGRISIGWDESLNYENGQNDAEKAIDPSGDDPGLGQGELGDYLKTSVRLAYPGTTSPVCESEKKLANQLPGTVWQPEHSSYLCNQLSLLEPGESVQLWVVVKVLENSGNIVQSDGVEVSFTINLQQE